MQTEDDMIKVFKLDVKHVEKPDDAGLQELPAASQPAAFSEVELVVNEPCTLHSHMEYQRQTAVVRWYLHKRP